ncbi:hypothetical protein [Ferrimicrobium sp.]|uniref:hypothetical protein n=1 Tax=Ferrimicrobium sp. TaxID=2926050 RepID=UPI0026113677|nr:hypothetical protein [Ferrimicrobium sp.]
MSGEPPRNWVRQSGVDVDQGRGLTTLSDLEGITSARVHSCNTSRLMHRLGRRPPTKVEAEY